MNDAKSNARFTFLATLLEDLITAADGARSAQATEADVTELHWAVRDADDEGIPMETVMKSSGLLRADVLTILESRPTT